MADNPVLGALEAFNRTHPHRQVDPDEVVAKARTLEDSEASGSPLTHLSPEDSAVTSPSAVASEQLALAPTFEWGPNGWLMATVTPSDVERAKHRHDEVSAEAVGYYRTEDRAWAGFLFEEFVARWLDSELIAYERNGGLDKRPDFEIGRFAVGVRVRVFRPDPKTILTWPVRQDRPEQILFGVFDLRCERIYIAGGISGPRFEREARIVPRGTEIARGFNADVDVLVGDTSMLDDPRSWLVLLRA